jgi:very-short-patch-repair endonuclease
MTDRAARIAVQELALSQDGVVSRSQAADLGVDRHMVAREVGTGRWRVYGAHGIAVHPMPLDPRAVIRVAQWEAGPRAVVDGSTSLSWAGLMNFDDGIHLICPWPDGGNAWNGSHIHNSRLWDPDDFVMTDGLLRTRNDVAAARAGMHARTDRAAATVMAMSVQQRLTRGVDLLLQVKRVNRHKRRPFLLRIALDIADGAQALSELDVARLCRERGLPEPTRQALRRGPKGKIYLDVYWDDFQVAVEVEGIHHEWVENSVDDALRQNAITIGQDAVLRIPILGLRTCPNLFLDQIEQMLQVAGWRRAG